MSDVMTRNPSTCRPGRAGRDLAAARRGGGMTVVRAPPARRPRIEVTFCEVAFSEDLVCGVRECAGDLGAAGDGCEVVLTRRADAAGIGRAFRVRLYLPPPAGPLTVQHEGPDARAAVREAFQTARASLRLRARAAP